MRSLLLCVLLSCSAVAQNAGTIFLVRHAEKASNAKDAVLSGVGNQRAECLSATLRDSDISSIIVSEFKRTQQTAAPLANLTKIEPTVVPAGDFVQIAAKAQAAAGHGNVLIVAHSNTIPEILAALGAPKAPVADDEFDRVFLVVGSGSQATTVRFRFCPAVPAPE